MVNTYQMLLYFLLVFLLVNRGRSIEHRQKRIVGGEPVEKPGKWPWIASLWFNQTHYCGGSIVGKKWIVTTAHCFHAHTSHDPRDWLVKVGKHDLSKNESHEQTFSVERIIRHPNYTSIWDTYKIDKPDDNDVALLELNGKIKYSNYTRPIRLLRNGIRFHPGHECYIAGWGHTYFSADAIQNIIREVKVELVSREKCNSPESYNGSVHERAICAGYEEGGRDACQYDSGGPLFCGKKQKTTKWYLVGQVSWGDKCAMPHKYGVYSNMEALGPWVVHTIKASRSKVLYKRIG
ncbi:prostasin-like isoform X2 [Dendronephthya gigantea]|uniref:prostasin-like isoform X2 n=1 Tax=Dendronephthya gigantea TaxID=151771 RepID=UPI00106BC593|nr:prostasin-like isoform X2 [Dendronephthya gigantea]